MPRTAARKDTNHNEIADAFQRLGWYWKDTYQLGLGFGDGIASRPWVNVIIEIKGPGGKLTPAEQEFHEICPGPVEVVTSLDDVLAVNEKYARPDWYYVDAY
jgi:hypothetical protein